MSLSQATVAKYCIFLYLYLHTVGLSAAIQTTPYLALHSQPKYQHLAAMPYANPHAPKGGELIQAVQGTFNNLNSMNGKGVSTAGVNYLFDTLMSRSLDEPGVFYPLLAQSVTYDPQKLDTVIFNLNPKARFSNGQALTAMDVKFSFDLYQEKGNFGLQMYLSDLAKTEVLNTYQVKFIFKSKHNVEMPLILSSFPIYSKRDWKNKDFSKISLAPIVGSGPYMVAHVDAGRSITYRRNPNYWGRHLAVNVGRYNFQQLSYKYYRSPQVALEAFKAGQYTFHEEFSPKAWVSTYQFSAARSGKIVKYTFKHSNPIPTKSYVFNTRKAPLNNISFRKALSYAYDFEWKNKAFFYGQYRRLQSYFDNSELAATGEPSVEELKVVANKLKQLHPEMQQAFLRPWKYPVSDGTGFNRKNLLIARSILLQSGFYYQDGLLYDQQRKPLQIEFLIYQDEQKRDLLPFTRLMKKLGIHTTIRQVDLPQYYQRIRQYDFDMTVLEMPQSLTPSMEQLQMWSSTAAKQYGNYNYAGIQEPIIDDVLQHLVHATKRQETILYTRVLDRLLRAGYYHILTYGKGEKWFAYWNIYARPTVAPKLAEGVDYWWASEP